MDTVMKMAGYCAAHAVAGVASGEILVPIVGKLKADGRRSLLRLAMGSVEAMARGAQYLEEFDADDRGVVFIKDALVTLETGRTDCLIVDIRFAEHAGKTLQYLIPYRNANHPQGFAVHRLKVMDCEAIDGEGLARCTEAFFDGRDAHEDAAALWHRHYIEEAGVSADHAGEENTAFSGEEFEALKMAPFLVFFLVAAADGRIDKKELLAFGKLLSNSARYSNPLLTRIITNIISDIPALAGTLTQKRLNFAAELTIIRGIVDSRMPLPQAEAFKRALFQVGQDIAEASGGFFGFGSKISKEERLALACIAFCLDIQLA
ncbi:MAG: hypothetical protein ABWY06_01360 [Pseudomonas sp.]|uniref:hypothetical protein n=1 Tax=Pseudomonas sp. TaxID=306 RepID=UPI0033987342